MPAREVSGHFQLAHEYQGAKDLLTGDGLAADDGVRAQHGGGFEADCTGIAGREFEPRLYGDTPEPGDRTGEVGVGGVAAAV